jgi:hypothetical protein
MEFKKRQGVDGWLSIPVASQGFRDAEGRRSRRAPNLTSLSIHCPDVGGRDQEWKLTYCTTRLGWA